MIWQIWWLVIACGLAMWIALAVRASDDDSEFVLSAAEVARIEEARYRALGSRT
jgi:cytochrome o ubiquinol oxidase subunit 1